MSNLYTPFVGDSMATAGGYLRRVMIKIAAQLATGTQAQLTIMHSGTDWELTQCCIGYCELATPNEFVAGSAVQVTFNGGEVGQVITASDRTSDIVDFVIDGTKNILVSFDCGAGGSCRWIHIPGSDYGAYYKATSVSVCETGISPMSTNTNQFNGIEAIDVTSAGGAKLLSFVDMPYGDMSATLRAILNMPYNITFSLTAFVDMPYGIKLGMALNMPYGDAPTLKSITDMHYGDNPVIRHILDMPYDSLLTLKHAVDMPYNVLFDLMHKVDMPYHLTGEKLRAVLNMPFDLQQNNHLLSVLHMPYMLQSNARRQTVTSSLTVGGRVVDYHHLNIEASRDGSVITGEAHIASLGQYLLMDDGDPVEVVCNETTFTLILESKKRNRPGKAATNFILSFASPYKKQSAPWTRPLTQEFAASTSETIISSLSGGLEIDYRTEITPDIPGTPIFPVLADTLYANGEDRRTIIRKLTVSVGARIQSNPDGSIRIEPDYPVPVSKWGTVVPAYFMTDSINFVSQDETPVKNSGENQYLVGNTLSSNERTWPEKKNISGSEAEVYGFQVPWGYKEIERLTHSGGDWVYEPIYMGVVEEIYPPIGEDAEQVEFVAGFANAARPIYGDLHIEWLRDGLGSITYGEDGKLEAEFKTGATDGYGLAAIRYLTRYHRWIVKDDVAENVQYILWVEE